MTGKCSFHNASIYPHLADVKGLSELRTQKGIWQGCIPGTAILARCLKSLSRSQKCGF
jgi:hypothetical protein